MKLDDILQVMAKHLGAEVVSLKDREFPPELLQTDSRPTSRRCIGACRWR